MACGSQMIDVLSELSRASARAASQLTRLAGTSCGQAAPEVEANGWAGSMARATASMCETVKQWCDLYAKLAGRPDAPAGDGRVESTVTIDDARVPEVIGGRFRIVRFIGRGGMGEVYEAEDLAMASRPHVALKTIRPEAAPESAMAARFEREIKMSRRVTHPNVCRVYDLGIHRSASSAVLFLTMELLSGGTLGTRLRECGPFTAAEAWPLIRQTAGGLDAIHEAGIVHLDLKPENIMLERVENQPFPRAVITDFGLAKPVNTEGVLVRDTESRGGTRDYMSPEQVMGGALGARSDVYSFGVLVYETLSGKLPFHGGDSTVRMCQRLLHSPVPLRERVPDIDPTWEAAIMKCLSFDPGLRFASARDVANALDGDKRPHVRAPKSFMAFEAMAAA
jgi:serine/threonine protein kinase